MSNHPSLDGENRSSENQSMNPQIREADLLQQAAFLQQLLAQQQQLQQQPTSFSSQATIAPAPYPPPHQSQIRQPQHQSSQTNLLSQFPLPVPSVVQPQQQQQQQQPALPQQQQQQQQAPNLPNMQFQVASAPSASQFFSFNQVGQPMAFPTSIGQLQQRSRSRPFGGRTDWNGRESFFIFIKIVMKITANNPRANSRAKAVISECTRRNRMGDADFTPLPEAIGRRLKGVLGDMYWFRAKLYFDAYCEMNGIHSEQQFLAVAPV